MWLCGVQMVAMNYQTSDTGLLLNEGPRGHDLISVSVLILHCYR